MFLEKGLVKLPQKDIEHECFSPLLLLILLLLLPSPSTIEYYARLGDLCTARPSANPLNHLAT